MAMRGWLLILVLVASAGHLQAQSEPDPPAPAEAPADQRQGPALFPYEEVLRLFHEPAYRTPLAGEAYTGEVLGVPVDIPARDRTDQLALNVGALYVTPDIADQKIIPFGAFYARQSWLPTRRQLRGVLAGLYNEVDYFDGSWNDFGLRAAFYWENSTIPFARTEVVDGEEIEESALEWGTLFAGVGLELPVPLAPFNFDNRLRLLARYDLGYFYSARSKETPDDIELPPDTFIHRLFLAVRADAFKRNIMELLHEGWGAGFSLELSHRERWSDLDNPAVGQFFPADATRDYLKLEGYVVAAFGLPFLSERHRFLTLAHGGWSPSDDLDRFSAFRRGGGPPPSEAHDLDRHPLPGALFEQVPASRYLTLTVEYRFELFFFFYLHARGTLAWATIPTFDDDELVFDDAFTVAFSAGVTTGFFFDSLLYVEYAYDDGDIRRTDTGHAIMLSWSKAF